MQKAVLMGPFVGEMGWELLRFAPMLPYMKIKKYKGQNIKFIVFTRPERFDLYGIWADTLVPLRLKDDYIKYKPECFRAIGFSAKTYNKFAESFRKQFSNKYKIIEHIYPKVTKPAYLTKSQYPQKLMLYDYRPRKANRVLVGKYVPNDKPIVVLGPRLRKGFKRNWPHWQKFYNMISTNSWLMNNFHFVICGKEPEYVPDEKQRFFDINSIEEHENSSLIGLTLETVKKSVLVVGSQSAIPNVGMILKIEVLQWGNEPQAHKKTYNVFNTKVNFITDKFYKTPPERVIKDMTKILKRKLKEGAKK
jgi:hypothetical protein